MVGQGRVKHLGKREGMVGGMIRIGMSIEILVIGVGINSHLGRWTLINVRGSGIEEGVERHTGCW